MTRAQIQEEYRLEKKLRTQSELEGLYRADLASRLARLLNSTQLLAILDRVQSGQFSL